jgi:hypothetical protein
MATRTPRVFNIYAGDTLNLGAFASASGADIIPSSVNFSWSTNDSTVLQLTPSGMTNQQCAVKALKNGLANLICKVFGGPMNSESLTETITISVGYVLADELTIGGGPPAA